ncbi:hypothetical protein HYV50_03885 [Candidatus Pacearchaeota archaeon]|nr:hypothetical protein [Candidatus Pacearchaeota archaeon]
MVKITYVCDEITSADRNFNYGLDKKAILVEFDNEVERFSDAAELLAKEYGEFSSLESLLSKQKHALPGRRFPYQDIISNGQIVLSFYLDVTDVEGQLVRREGLSEERFSEFHKYLSQKYPDPDVPAKKLKS